ncbi:MAG: tetratricopeptide repeat protein [Chitinophagales bacterium]|nr:tetratricopeptide repeat protein [Chitinophagales bacterium]
MKKLLSLALTALLCANIYAQSGKVITAFNLFTDYQTSGNANRQSLEEAYTNISEASAHESTKADPKTWYYYGLVSQLLFQDSILSPKYPNAPFEASTAYQTAVKLTEVPEAKKFRYYEETVNNLGLVAGQLYNYGITQFDGGKNLVEAYKAFNEVLIVNEFLTARNLQAKMKVKAENSRYLAAVTADAIGKTEEAKKLFLKLVETKYDKIYIYKKLGEIYTKQDSTQQALSILEKGIAAYPDSVSLTIDKLNIYLVSGRQTEAIDIMNLAIKQDPKNAQLYFVLANTYGKMKDEANAIANYNKAIEVDPKYSDAYNNLGAIYIDKANALVEKMSDPKMPDAQYQKMDAERLAYLKQALPYLEKALQLKPDNVNIMDALKMIYAKMGDYDKVNEMKQKITAAQKKG